jgi:hypothetical protein
VNLPYIWPSIAVVAIAAALLYKDMKLKASNFFWILVLYIVTLACILLGVFLSHAAFEAMAL